MWHRQRLGPILRYSLQTQHRTTAGIYRILTTDIVVMAIASWLAHNKVFLYTECSIQAKSAVCPYMAPISNVVIRLCIIGLSLSGKIRRILSRRGFGKARRTALWDSKGRKQGGFGGQPAFSPRARGLKDRCKLPQLHGSGAVPQWFSFLNVPWWQWRSMANEIVKPDA